MEVLYVFSESETVELKAEVVSDICKEVIAFANTKGGVLYIGVADDGDIIGVENANGSRRTALSGGQRQKDDV